MTDWYHWRTVTPADRLHDLHEKIGGEDASLRTVMNLLRIGFRLPLEALTPGATLESLCQRRQGRRSDRAASAIALIRQHLDLPTSSHAWEKMRVGDLVRSWPAFSPHGGREDEPVNVSSAGRGSQDGLCRLAIREELCLTELLRRQCHAYAGSPIPIAVLEQLQRYLDMPFGFFRSLDAAVESVHELEFVLGPLLLANVAEALGCDMLEHWTFDPDRCLAPQCCHPSAHNLRRDSRGLVALIARWLPVLDDDPKAVPSITVGSLVDNLVRAYEPHARTD